MKYTVKECRMIYIGTDTQNDFRVGKKINGVMIKRIVEIFEEVGIFYEIYDEKERLYTRIVNVPVVAYYKLDDAPNT